MGGRGGRGRGLLFGAFFAVAPTHTSLTGKNVLHRRIERLLLLTSPPASAQPSLSSSPTTPRTPIPPRTLGLLLLSTTTLRSYALSSLPARSRLRAGFLEDVGDLEDPALGRAEKLEVVGRMWRSWGGVLGWREGGGGR